VSCGLGVWRWLCACFDTVTCVLAERGWGGWRSGVRPQKRPPSWIVSQPHKPSQKTHGHHKRPHHRRGELGLTRSQMISLERQLAQTNRQLRNVEKRAEQTWQDSRRDSRGANDTFMWD